MPEYVTPSRKYRSKDWTGERFGAVTVASFDGVTAAGNRYWNCLCDCGVEKAFLIENLKRGKSTSCGCSRVGNEAEDIAGRRFSRLVVIERDGTSWPTRWNCLCDCGNVKSILRTCLISGGTQSCGCLNSELKSARQATTAANYLARNVIVRKEVASAVGLDDLSYYRQRQLRMDVNGRESWTKPQVWEQSGGVCWICEKPADPANWHPDHKVSVRNGGRDALDNLAVAHPVCNQRKNSGKRGPDPLLKLIGLPAHKKG